MVAVSVQSSQRKEEAVAEPGLEGRYGGGIFVWVKPA